MTELLDDNEWLDVLRIQGIVAQGKLAGFLENFKTFGVGEIAMSNRRGVEKTDDQDRGASDSLKTDEDDN